MLAGFESQRHGSLVVQKLEHRSFKLFFNPEENGNGKLLSKPSVTKRVTDCCERYASGRRRMHVQNVNLIAGRM